MFTEEQTMSKKTESVHDRECTECGKKFTTEAKRGRPFSKCPACRKAAKKAKK